MVVGGQSLNIPNAIGDPNARLKVYIGNVPTFNWLPTMQKDAVLPLISGEVKAIGDHCGNGWRKVFNVYAKLVFAMGRKHFRFQCNFKSWQEYREGELLQDHSSTLLCFMPPTFDSYKNVEGINHQPLHFIMGRGYAKSLNLPSSVRWLNNEFAIDEQHRLLVCPYFDYRQLSNQKILFLAETIQLTFGKIR